MTEELLPCEHCPNSMVSTILGDVSLRWQVFCGRCGSSSGSCKTEDEAIKLWNTRSQPKYKRVDLETLYQLDIVWLSSVALPTKHNVEVK
jgi:hypothetical protein